MKHYKLKSTTKLDYDNDQARIQLYNLSAIKKRAIHQLQGVASSIIYDGIITDDEIGQLLSWLDQNRLVHNDWPVSHLIDLLDGILSDNVVTDEERKELLHFLSCITSQFSCDWMPRSITDLISKETIIEFQGRSFLRGYCNLERGKKPNLKY